MTMGKATAGRIQKWRGELVRWRGVVYSKGGLIDMLISKYNAAPHIGNYMADYNRRKFNNMNQDEQKIYMKKLERPRYEIKFDIEGDIIALDIPKILYDELIK